VFTGFNESLEQILWRNAFETGFSFTLKKKKQQIDIKYTQDGIGNKPAGQGEQRGSASGKRKSA
jgi:hypothetical protein